MKHGTPNLLFLSPVVPAHAGNGLAMRAALFLEALSQDFNIHLQIIPVSGAADPESIPSFVKSLTHAVYTLDLEQHLDPHFALIQQLKDGPERLAALAAYPKPVLSRFSTSVAINEASNVFADVSFSLVHVMRLYLAPFATPYLDSGQNAPLVTLDLDDNEVKTRQRLSALYASNGNEDAAALETAEAATYQDYERSYLPRFSRLIVCSDSDKDDLKTRYGLDQTSVIPNAVRRVARSHADKSDELSVLVLGTMGYYPNEDAALYFCQDVLPILRTKTERNINFVIAGSNPPESIRQLEKIEGVKVTGTVPHVTQYYQSADLVVVPIRAGGGTRIKILEAFAHGVPVVSTPLGAEGLAVVDGRHLLLAETAENFAECCLTVLDDEDLADRLHTNAGALFNSTYEIDVVARLIAGLYQNLLELRTG